MKLTTEKIITTKFQICKGGLFSCGFASKMLWAFSTFFVGVYILEPPQLTKTLVLLRDGASQRILKQVTLRTGSCSL